MATSELVKLRQGAGADTGPLSARAWNKIVEVVQSVLGMRGGPGILVKRGATGLIVSLDPDTTLEIPATITQASGTAPGVANFTYTATPIGRKDINPLVNKAPDEGRPVNPADGVFVYPAAVGDRCTIVLVPTGTGAGVHTSRLRVYTEKIAFGPCP